MSDLRSNPRRYLARDFDEFKRDAFEHARALYGNKIRDLSESGLGGLLLDTCAMIGDSLSFYQDHQFGELSSETAVESKSMQRLARAAGVRLSGASPAIIDSQRFSVKIPAVRVGSAWKPDVSLLPIIRAGAVVSDGSVDFTLLNDIDFAVTGSDGSLLAQVKIGDRSADSQPRTFIVSAAGECSSGTITEEAFSIGAAFVPFRRLTLSAQDVSQIVTVVDSLGNVYREVASLAHDTVYLVTDSRSTDASEPEASIHPVAAPYRFVSQFDPSTRLTTLTFGGGTASALDADAVQDPSSYALSLRGHTSLARQQITPEKLLRSRTLGVAATNVTLTVSYRAGGGVSHNVAKGRVNVVRSARTSFPGSTSAPLIAAVKSTLQTVNDDAGSGGEEPLTFEALRAVIASSRASQDRIVTQKDLIARVYAMPAQLGRVFKVGVSTSQLLPGVSQLHVVSRDADKKLTQTSAAIKRNIAVWLGEHRLIADSVDIRDAVIINLTVSFEISVLAGLNKTLILRRAAQAIETELSSETLSVNEAINIDALKNALFGVTGVTGVGSLVIGAASGLIGGREYPGAIFDVGAQTRKGFVLPLSGGVFELRYPEFDIAGVAT